MSWLRSYRIRDRMAYWIAGRLPKRVQLMAYMRQAGEKPLWDEKAWNRPENRPLPKSTKGVSDV